MWNPGDTHSSTVPVGLGRRSSVLRRVRVYAVHSTSARWEGVCVLVWPRAATWALFGLPSSVAPGLEKRPAGDSDGSHSETQPVGRGHGFPKGAWNRPWLSPRLPTSETSSRDRLRSASVASPLRSVSGEYLPHGVSVRIAWLEVWKAPTSTWHVESTWW